MYHCSNTGNLEYSIFMKRNVTFKFRNSVSYLMVTIKYCQNWVQSKLIYLQISYLVKSKILINLIFAGAQKSLYICYSCKKKNQDHKFLSDLKNGFQTIQNFCRFSVNCSSTAKLDYWIFLKSNVLFKF